ncbi:hypothetical protein GGR51DRAFT_556168 [Nemania sp. FL0031]|nr:hypothetical protein GGR51DRAFT_556168 [Nemania sp. FL0031]
MAPQNSITNKTHPKSQGNLIARGIRAAIESFNQRKEQRAIELSKGRIIAIPPRGAETIYERPNPSARRISSPWDNKNAQTNKSTASQTKENEPKNRAERTKQAGQTETTEDTKLAGSTTKTIETNEAWSFKNPNQATTTKTSEGTQKASPVQTNKDDQKNEELPGRRGSITREFSPKKLNPASAQTTPQINGSVRKTGATRSRKSVPGAGSISGTSQRRRVKTSCLLCPQKVGNMVARNFDPDKALPSITEQVEQEHEREKAETDNLSNISCCTTVTTSTTHSVS